MPVTGETMPVVRGYTKRAISKNISELYRAGKKLPQAVAISLKVAREAYQERFPKKQLPKHLRNP